MTRPEGDPGRSHVPEPAPGRPPDPKPYVDRVLPDAANATAGVRVAGFMLGAGAAFVGGLGLFLAVLYGMTMVAQGSEWIGVLAAGIVQLVLAAFLGRWLWKSKQMKGMAVGLILCSALWCTFDVSCGLILQNY
ncbi:MAG: hypothetical protein HMLKMBBP_03988 [Planctomycetes bacterium]|nr:hypothetical protein [Planctomycetota bacterium]